MDRDGKMIVEVLGEPSRISPSDLYEKKFRRSFRGARMRDVNAFLEDVADEMEHVLDGNRRLRTQVRELLAQLEHFRSIEDTLRNALVSTEQFREQVADEARVNAETVVEKARTESEKTVADAQMEADAILAKAEKDRSAVEAQILILSEQRFELKQQLLDLLNRNIDLVNSVEIRVAEQMTLAEQEPEEEPEDPEKPEDPEDPEVVVVEEVETDEATETEDEPTDDSDEETETDDENEAEDVTDDDETESVVDAILGDEDSDEIKDDE